MTWNENEAEHQRYDEKNDNMDMTHMCHKDKYQRTYRSINGIHTIQLVIHVLDVIWFLAFFY